MDKFSRQIFSFRGRSLRVEWWLTQLILVAVGLVILSVVFGGAFPLTPMLWVVGAFVLLTTVIVVLVSIRRLHDRDKSGYWIWLFEFAPNTLAGLGDRLEDQGETGLAFGAICYLIAAGLWIWGIVVMGFLRGTSGPNRYGPDPLSSTGEGAQREG